MYVRLIETLTNKEKEERYDRKGNNNSPCNQLPCE